MNLLGDLEMWIEELCSRFPATMNVMRTGDLENDEDLTPNMGFTRLSPWRTMTYSRLRKRRWMKLLRTLQQEEERKRPDKATAMITSRRRVRLAFSQCYSHK